MEYRFETSAWLQPIEAAAGYESERIGRGRALISDVRKLCALLKENSPMGRKVDLNHRRFPLKNYPYALVYTLLDDTLVVVPVVDGRRERDCGRRGSIRSVEEPAAEYAVACRAA